MQWEIDLSGLALTWMKDAAHMPYKTKENFIKRGYSVVRVDV